MRIVLQRVSQASVSVKGAVVGEIGPGLTALVAFARTDGDEQIRFCAEKILSLRIFPDESGKMNLGLRETGGSLLIVSQFTLYGDTRKGRRPSYDAAAPPDQARECYHRFVDYCRQSGVPVATGEFQAMMELSLVNDGPVTLIVEREASAVVRS